MHIGLRPKKKDEPGSSHRVRMGGLEWLTEREVGGHVLTEGSGAEQTEHPPVGGHLNGRERDTGEYCGQRCSQEH